jgi:hypothetical protein
VVGQSIDAFEQQLVDRAESRVVVIVFIPL